jgi:hypothetical protein
MGNLKRTRTNETTCILQIVFRHDVQVQKTGYIPHSGSYEVDKVG